MPKSGVLTLTSSVNHFEGETVTRTNLAGNAFADGDRMKLKIICPFSSRTEYGESTWGGSADGLWLMKWSGSNWVTIKAADKVDVGGRYEYSDAPNLFGQYEAQNTPYVYTASTWSENILFIANGKLWTQYSYIFHADQSEESNYLKSDLLWAQSYMQTGSYNVHLSFNHVMACLKITIPSTYSTTAVVTLEGMPDIDQKEVVVGDYYAYKAEATSRYGYKDKCSCTKDNNGKVLGVAVINETDQKAYVYRMSGNPADASSSNNTHGPVDNVGVYTAYNAGGHVYYLIVPPCNLTTAPTIWIRDGETRYSYQLLQTAFDQGVQYKFTL